MRSLVRDHRAVRIQRGGEGEVRWHKPQRMQERNASTPTPTHLPCGEHGRSSERGMAIRELGAGTARAGTWATEREHRSVCRTWKGSSEENKYPPSGREKLTLVKRPRG